jgi:nitrous oxide reductase accessory protein NosL
MRCFVCKVGLGTAALAVGLLLGGCAPLAKVDDGEAQLPYELTAEQCDNLIEIRTEGVNFEEVDGPPGEQMALDAASPD